MAEAETDQAGRAREEVVSRMQLIGRVLAAQRADQDELWSQSLPELLAHLRSSQKFLTV